MGVGEDPIVLDEDGTLTPATPTPDGLTVHAEAPVLEATARPAPTTLGTILFARDQASIVALDLGP